jgi:serine/threonine-protein kinase
VIDQPRSGIMTFVPDVLDDRYELVRPLGSGGMGDVFEAFDRRLDRKVAVKILRASVPDPRARDRFANEARVGAKFSHPNAVLVYDAGADGDRLYLVTELVEGRSLADVLAEHGPMDATETVAIIDQVLDALDAAHEHGIVHRDVKPSNVLLTSTGVAKLTDFGIAKASADATAGLTATGQVLGTAKYLSPEQATGEPADARSDLYSTAVMAYEMLAGSAPFTGDTPLAVAAAHANAPVPSLAERRPDLPAPLVAAVERGLEKDPAHRFADAEAMRAALSGGAADEATTLLASHPPRLLCPRRRAPTGDGCRWASRSPRARSCSSLRSPLPSRAAAMMVRPPHRRTALPPRRPPARRRRSRRSPRRPSTVPRSRSSCSRSTTRRRR